MMSKQCPRNVQATSVGVSVGMSIGVSTSIETLLIETLLTETLLKLLSRRKKEFEKFKTHRVPQ